MGQAGVQRPVQADPPHRRDRPSYTLGDLEAKKRQIRERLKSDGIFDRNRLLPTPWDYRTLLVVSPPPAAGLGDFARDADRLQRHELCEVIYTHSRFEGDGAPALILEAIQTALGTWPQRAPPDAVVIIRGGGAVNDLAWLNDYELARFVCLNPVPVLTGIGHERDNTLLDEVAHQRFDTPSKVVAGIQALIVKRARESEAAFEEVADLALRQLRTAQGLVNDLNGNIQRPAVEVVTGAHTGIHERLAIVQRAAQRTLHDAAQGALQALSRIRTGAAIQLSRARVNASSLATRVQESAAADAAAQRHQTHELAEEVKRLARNSLRWGAEAAEATFREVVAQGPEKTLGRGFAVVHGPLGHVVTSAAVEGEGFSDSLKAPVRLLRISDFFRKCVRCSLARGPAASRDYPGGPCGGGRNRWVLGKCTHQPVRERETRPSGRHSSKPCQGTWDPCRVPVRC